MKPVTLLNPSSAIAVRAIESAGVVVYQYGFRPSLRVEYVSPSAALVFGLQAESFYADPYAPCASVHFEDRAGFEAMLTDTRGVPQLEGPLSPGSSRIEEAKAAGLAQLDQVRRVGDLVRDNPNEAAIIIRNWLGEAA